MNFLKMGKISCSKKLSENKAQALVELAIFGSILLFCVAILIQYALEGGYLQQVQMEAFRKALKLAYYKSGPTDSSSLVLIKDKPIPDPRDQWGFAERYPIIGSGSAVWDNALSGQYVKSFDGAITADDVPAIYFEIDKANPPSQAKAHVPSEAGEGQVFALYTAQFETIPCSTAGTLTVVLDDPNCPGSGAGCSDYTTRSVSCNAIKVMSLEGNEAHITSSDSEEILMSIYYKDGNGLKRRMGAADLDGDGEVEEIIAANAQKNILYIDYHSRKDVASKVGTVRGEPEIQLDTIYANTAPYPYGPKGVVLDDKQGIIGNFTKTVTHSGSNIVKKENKGSITSSTNLQATQKIIHKIRLNDGTVLDIPADFVVNASDLYKW
ncbi:MAG: hypothetical protein NTW64_01985 [Candidatus Omnitrophica bacterium]|nr:hypothetical protein [Candidatus Omnitrophota bacterium]